MDITCNKSPSMGIEILRHPSPLSSMRTLYSAGQNVRHTQLTLVNLSNNAIASFGAQTLIGMPRVEYLYLADNRLDAIDDSEQTPPFNFLTSLKHLDLSRVFGAHISVRARAELVRRLFANNHSFVDLQEVALRGNQLDHLHADTFCNVSAHMRKRESLLSHNLIFSK